MITIMVEFLEGQDDIVTLSVKTKAKSPLTMKELMASGQMQEAIAKIVKTTADQSSRAVYAEGSSAEALYKSIHKKKEGGDDGSTNNRI